MPVFFFLILLLLLLRCTPDDIRMHRCRSAKEPESRSRRKATQAI